MTPSAFLAREASESECLLVPLEPKPQRPPYATPISPSNLPVVKPYTFDHPSMALPTPIPCPPCASITFPSPSVPPDPQHPPLASSRRVYLMRDKKARALVCVKVIKLRNIPRKVSLEVPTRDLILTNSSPPLSLPPGERGLQEGG